MWTSCKDMIIDLSSIVMHWRTLPRHTDRAQQQPARSPLPPRQPCAARQMVQAHKLANAPTHTAEQGSLNTHLCHNPFNPQNQDSSCQLLSAGSTAPAMPSTIRLQQHVVSTAIQHDPLMWVTPWHMPDSKGCCDC